MAAESKIEWTKATWNPWVGCEKVSPGCKFCYAETWAARTGRDVWGADQRQRTSADYWRQPKKWNAQAVAEIIAGTTTERPRVFPSLCDPFEDRPEVARTAADRPSAGLPREGRGAPRASPAARA